MANEQYDEVSVTVVGIASTTATSAIAGIINSVNKTPDPNDDIAVYAVCLIAAAIITGCYYLARNLRARHCAEIRELTENQRDITTSLKEIQSNVDHITDDIVVMSNALVGQVRSDLIHRATKYIVDRSTGDSPGWITQEEKQSWLADYGKYNALTVMYKIDNHYLVRLRERIEDLPIKSI